MQVITTSVSCTYVLAFRWRGWRGRQWETCSCCVPPIVPGNWTRHSYVASNGGYTFPYPASGWLQDSQYTLGVTVLCLPHKHTLCTHRQARRHLLELHAAETLVSLSELEWDLLVSRTEGYSGSDIATCVADALLEPVRELEGAQFWRAGGQLFTPCPASDPRAVRCSLGDLPPHQVVIPRQ